MSLRVSLVAAVALGAAAFAPAARAHEASQLSLAQLVPDFSERLTLRMQEEGVLDSILPKGPLADDPWEPGIVIGQWAASAAVSCLGVYVFNSLAQSEFATLTGEGDALKSAQRNTLLFWGFLQFASVPLVSGAGVWGVGNLSDVYEVGFGVPLLANYGAELALILLRIGLGIGGLQGTDAVGAVTTITDALGVYNIVDYVLHALVVPVTVTYFSIRSRGPKSMEWGARDLPLPAYASVRPSVRSAADERDRRASDVSAPAFSMSLANLSF